MIFLLAGLTARSQDEKLKVLETEADTLFNHEDYEGALKLYSRILETAKSEDKSVSPIFYKRAVCYYSLSNFASALKDIDVFIGKNPEQPRARLLRAFVHKALGELDLQIADLNFVLEAQPGNHDLLKWRASAPGTDSGE